jgi:hypothetical protein
LRNASWRRPPQGRAPTRPATAQFRPRLEALEDRWLPSQVGLTVNSLADSGPGTLRAAILTADAGSHSDTYSIDFAKSGVIDLQSPLPDLNNSISIQGPGASSLTVERAAGYSFSSAILTVDAGQTAGLSGLKIANGNAGGIINNGTLTVSGCTISGNAADNGGGIHNTGTLTVSNNSTVSGNSAGNNGGGIWNSGASLNWVGSLTVSNSTVSGNHADGDAGGGIMNFFGSLTVSASAVSGNTAVVGGGIFSNGTATIQLSSTLSGNSAEDGGGIENGGPLTVSGCTLSGNTATGFNFGGSHFPGRGGAIDNSGDSTLTTVRDSVFSCNSAELGGAIFNSANYGTLDVRGSTFSRNSASDSGGAIYNQHSTATIQGCTLSGNLAGTAGGGLFNAATGTLTVKDSTVLGNTAPSGADLYNLGALTLDDSTVGVIGP